MAHSAPVAVTLSGSAPSTQAQGKVPGQYIVVFKADAINTRGLTNSLARVHGFSVGYVYQFALKGFSARMSAQAAAALSADPDVAYVEQDTYMHAVAVSTPTGVRRIEADVNLYAVNPVDVDIAIIDSGVAPHPDLNIYRATDCSGGNPFRGRCRGSSAPDDFGHGTHVAGTAAARGVDRVVGVAPGARIWAAKVLDENGSGFASWVIAGVDWVTQNSGEVEVANMSLGGGNSQALKDAIRNSVDAGVTYVVAAGNDHVDAANSSPANAPDAITVSGIADFDGAGDVTAIAPPPGWPDFCAEEVDDSFYNSSNYGSVVDIAAPGVCILSTYLNGGLAVGTGTSMASPHVAGAAALILVENPGFTPQQVREALLASATPQNHADGYVNDGTITYDDVVFGGVDPDEFAEPLVNAAGSGGGNARPEVTITEPLPGTVSGTSLSVTANASDSDGTVVGVAFLVDGVSLATSTELNGVWSTTWDTTASSEGDHALMATATDDIGDTGSDSISVTVDNYADPTVGIDSPLSDTTVSSTIIVSASAGAATGLSVTQVEFFVDGASIGADADATDGWSIPWDTTATPNGLHLLGAVVTDSKTQTASDEVSVNVDNVVTTRDMYVNVITFREQGPHLNVTVTIWGDIDGDGTLGGDGAVAGVTVNQVALILDADNDGFDCDPTEGCWKFKPLDTDSAGQTSYKLIRAPNGSYQFEVLDLVDSNGIYVWNPAVGGDNPNWFCNLVEPECGL